MVIGVAGGYCTGKDTVVAILERSGYPSIDVDTVGHRVLEELAPKVREVFGEGVVGEGGRIDRAALGRVVFRDRRALDLLEGILHPRMREIVAAWVAERGRRGVVNAAVLYRMGLHELCDAVICVRAPLWARVRRARRRDGRRFGAALARIWSQRGICLKPMGARVDTYTVRNAGSAADLERAVQAVVSRLRAEP